MLFMRFIVLDSPWNVEAEARPESDLSHASRLGLNVVALPKRHTASLPPHAGAFKNSDETFPGHRSV
jgi:hypothetical protein